MMMQRRHWLTLLALVLLGYLIGLAVNRPPREEWKVYQFGPNNVGLERVNVRTGVTQFSGLGCPWYPTWPKAYQCMRATLQGR